MQADEIRGAIEQAGLLLNVATVTPPIAGAYIGLEGQVEIEGKRVTLQLFIDQSPPLQLPIIRLQPWDALGFISHVNLHGFICYQDSEGLVIDSRRPVTVVLEALQLAINVLRDGLTGKNQRDFVDEFEVNWSRLQNISFMISVFDPVDRVCLLGNYKAGKSQFLAHDEMEIAAFHNGAPPAALRKLADVLYLPLQADPLLIPPRPDGLFWDVTLARRELTSRLSKPNQDRLNSLIKGTTDATVYVVARVPRPSGGASLFGIRYEGVGELHPLREGGLAESLSPFLVDRLDRSFLVQRGGGNHALAEKRVLLIGCGAVGGHLAVQLARAGICNLTLVDRDKLEHDNTFRHELGRRYWRCTKVRALKNLIESELPYVRVTAISKSIEQALTDGSIDLGSYDLVISAMGNPTMELELNERLYAMRHRPLALFTWLEPLGIGGHALLTGNAAGPGCFECLYTSPDEDNKVLHNRVAFAAPDQSFGRDLSGCGSLYTPYGSMDAMQTATLAARLAVDALLARERGNPLCSWRGAATEFEAAGFLLALRFDLTHDELEQQRYAYASPRCRVCGYDATSVH